MNKLRPLLQQTIYFQGFGALSIRKLIFKVQLYVGGAGVKICTCVATDGKYQFKNAFRNKFHLKNQKL